MSSNETNKILFPLEFPILRNSYLTLRENNETDILSWFSRATDHESADLAGDPIPESIEQGAVWLRRQKDHFLKQTALRWAIEVNNTGVSVGSIGLTIASYELQIADLGIVIGRSSWGKGIGFSAVELVKGYAFHQLQLRLIQAEVLERNKASIRLLTKCGFVLTNHKFGEIDESEEPMLKYALSFK